MNETRKLLNEMLAELLVDGGEETFTDYEELLDFAPPTTVAEIEALPDADALALMCVYGQFLG